MPAIGDTFVTNSQKPDYRRGQVRMFVSPQPPKAKRQPVFRRLPFGAVRGFAPLCLDPDSQETQVEGIKKRLGAKVGTAHGGRFPEHAVQEYVAEKLRNIPPLDRVMDYEEWLNSTSYNEARKGELRREIEKFQHRGYDPKKLGRVTPFVKRESYPQNKHARWINAPTDLFKVVSGPAFKSIEAVVYDLDLFGKGHSCFIKHVPVQERPVTIEKLKAFGNKFIGTDFTAFESHMTVGVMQSIECQVYRHFLKNYPDLADLICSTLCGYRSGTTRAGVSFRTLGRRMSGDCCTSLGNGLTNIFMWAFLADRAGVKWDGYVEGDDGIFVVNGKSLTSSDYGGVGFNIKVEEATDPADLSFCGLVLAEGNVIRDPKKFFQNFGWSGSFLYSKLSVQNELLRAKALSVLYETPNCPIVAAVARRALELTEGYNARFVADGYHHYKEHEEITVSDISVGTRLQFQRLYQLSPQVQLELERRISTSRDLDFLSEYFTPHIDVNRYASAYLEWG